MLTFCKAKPGSMYIMLSTVFARYANPFDMKEIMFAKVFYKKNLNRMSLLKN